MNVEICNNSVQWDTYVEASAAASRYHLWVWKQIIEETFGHKGYYLAARDREVIRGVLPLVWMQSRLFGNFLVSVPFFSYGGVLADTTEARDGLLARAADLACDLGARHVELRQGSECDMSWRRVAAKVTMEIALPCKADTLWNKLSSGMRNKIRYGGKHGLSAQWGGSEAVDAFYPIFAANMRNLGTPVYPREWFANLCRQAPQSIRILTLWDEGQPVAGAFLTSFRDILELPWSASLPEARRKYAHIFLYWTFLQWAIEHGFRRMDLGRCTPGSGTHEFKRHWGCEEKPLHWYYWLAPGVPLPHLRPDNGHYRLAVEVWRHLPLPVANALGPRLVRSIP